jgi:hypothetical protein
MYMRIHYSEYCHYHFVQSHLTLLVDSGCRLEYCWNFIQWEGVLFRVANLRINTVLNTYVSIQSLESCNTLSFVIIGCVYEHTEVVCYNNSEVDFCSGEMVSRVPIFKFADKNID